GPRGQLTWGVHTTLAPTWFDPAETPGIITPWMVLYALHDALVKPMPGNPLTPSLAESFSAAEDALTYDFVLRPGVKFHNGEPFEPCWRKIPSLKRLVFKGSPEETTRLAALKMGEVDIVYAINGELAKELRNTPGLTLKPVYPPGPFWLYFPEQWDATSPWHD